VFKPALFIFDLGFPFFSPIFLVLIYIFNFIVNGAFVIIITKVFGCFGKVMKQKQEMLVNLAIVTLLGLVVDVASLFIAGLVASSLLPYPENFLVSVLLFATFALVGMAALSYHFVFKKILKKDAALKAAVFFGLGNNPAWFLLVLAAFPIQQGLFAITLL